MEELLGLWARDDTPIAIRLLFLALAGLVEGKPMRMTLWMGANRPNLGRHWKYLQTAGGDTEAAISDGRMQCFGSHRQCLLHKKIGKHDFLWRPPWCYANEFNAQTWSHKLQFSDKPVSTLGHMVPGWEKNGGECQVALQGVSV